MFRRSGSFVAFHVEGRMPDPRSDAFLEALAGQRFRSIEDAASEEAAIGWVSPGDPTGDSFERDDLDLDRALWLRLRIDRKKLPPVWLRIRRAQAERSAGRKLSAAERKELKEALLDELLPRVLPNVQLVDLLFAPQHRLVLLFGTATGLRDECRNLWFRTFACELRESEPGSLATSLDLGRAATAYLDEVSPVDWSRTERDRAPRPAAAPAATGSAAAEHDAAATALEIDA